MNESFLERAKENILAAERLFAMDLYNASANPSLLRGVPCGIGGTFSEWFYAEYRP
jgi:hypothetical protein